MNAIVEISIQEQNSNFLLYILIQRLQELEFKLGDRSHILSRKDFSPALCLVKLYRDCTRRELEKGLFPWGQYAQMNEYI